MSSKLLNSGIIFSKYKLKNQSPFEKLFDIFKELITHTSGDFDEAIDWLRELDKEYKLTDENYTIDDFIDDL
jgi:Ca-activated chloride channel family protein